MAYFSVRNLVAVCVLSLCLVFLVFVKHLQVGRTDHLGVSDHLSTRSAEGAEEELSLASMDRIENQRLLEEEEEVEEVEGEVLVDDDEAHRQNKFTGSLSELEGDGVLHPDDLPRQQPEEEVLYLDDEPHRRNNATLLNPELLREWIDRFKERRVSQDGSGPAEGNTEAADEVGSHDSLTLQQENESIISEMNSKGPIPVQDHMKPQDDNEDLQERASNAEFISDVLRYVGIHKPHYQVGYHGNMEDDTESDLEGQSSVSFPDIPSRREFRPPPELPLHLKNASQDDPDLIQLIRDEWLYPPSTEPRTLRAPHLLDFSQFGQSLHIDRLLQNRTHGFYVEAGAANGEKGSNTLFFEIHHHWDGLLIEPNPKYFEELVSKNRRAYLANCCLSPTTTPVQVDFLTAMESGGISDYLPELQVEVSAQRKRTRDSPTVRMQCFPLYSLLRALGVSHVDYLSLDVEGVEVPVLESLPLDHVTFDVMSIERRVLGSRRQTREKEAGIVELLGSRGYRVLGENKLDIFMGRV